MGLAKGLKKVSSKTLLRLGGTVTIKRTTNSSYNDTSGEVRKIETSVDVKGNLENVSSVEVNDLISQEDKKLTLSAEGLQRPDIADRAQVESDASIQLRTIDRERKLISKIDAALRRIDLKTYGYCEETGEPIGLGRLKARPIASLSVDAQERHEKMEKIHKDE